MSRPLERVRHWFEGDATDTAPIPPLLRRLGGVWIGVSVPFITVVSAFTDSATSYLFVAVFMGAGAYTTPALVAGWYVVRHGPPGDRRSYAGLYTALVVTFLTGVSILVGMITGWRWGNPVGWVMVVLAGITGAVGLFGVVRSRSGYRALFVDLTEAGTAIVAVIAPLVVLWWPAVMDAEAFWFALPCAVALLFAVGGAYLATQLLVRLGPERRALQNIAVVFALLGCANAALHTAQGITGFDLPAPPLMLVNTLCFSMFLLIPLHTPVLINRGLSDLPPQAQVRGGWLATLVPLGGLAALLVATAIVADEQSWAVPFSLGAVSLLFVMWGLRQMAALHETRRLYGQVERAADERQTMLAQLIEQSVDDRRRFAGQLYAQTAAAYASFRQLADADPAIVPRASALLSGDMARQADSVRELTRALRPTNGDRQTQQLTAPIRAYLAALYGDRRGPELTITVDDEMSLDWMAETTLLQIVQEALNNVWRHSDAATVDITVEVVDDVVVIRVSDDGRGFDQSAVPEGTGIALIRAAAAVAGGTLVIDTRPGAGTTVSARLGPSRSDDGPREPGPSPSSPPNLRVVRDQPS